MTLGLSTLGLSTLSLLTMAAQQGCAPAAPLRPELASATQNGDAATLAEALERLIDRQQDSPEDRSAAYDIAHRWPLRSAADYYGRASLAGRLAEERGLTAVTLISEMEELARKSLALDAGYRDGAARRMLGTLYALAPAALLEHGDSERGIELLEDQLARFPGLPSNQLRLAEAYVALDDEEGAEAHLCSALKSRARLRASEQRLLASLLDATGGARALGCRQPAPGHAPK